MAATRAAVAAELLEVRRLFAVFTVNSTADTDTRDSVLTLREAVNLVNDTDPLAGVTAAEQAQIDLTNPIGTDDTIKFNLPGTGAQTITLGSGLEIDKSVTIDGYSQTGAAAATDSAAATILVQIDGQVSLIGNNITIRGLAMGDDEPVYIGGSNNTIAGDYIGIQADGSYFEGDRTGIGIAGSNNTIGGTTSADRNVIANIQGPGILIGTGGGNVVEGNYIGTNIAGTAVAGTGFTDPATAPLPNQYGISIDNSSGNRIGGTSAGTRNVISGSVVDAIEIGDPNAPNGTSANNVIEGNYIGTNAAGMSAIANGSYGVEVENSGGNTIGGTSAGAGNVVSGNTLGGVLLGSSNFDAIARTVVEGNSIGLNATGDAAIANAGAGVAVTGSDYLIGGSTAGAGNVISGNTLSGIEFNAGSGTALTGDIVQGNYIGTDATGMVAVANGSDGIRFDGPDTGAIPSTNITIGGTAAGTRNVISGNAGAGIAVFYVGGDNLIQGNYIGVDATGAKTLGNGDDGVIISGLEDTVSATDFTIGGLGAGAGNVISGNTDDGIDLSGSDGNMVQGNLIGVLADGITAAGNSQAGVSIEGSLNAIGGAVAEAGNVIAYNGGDGVGLFGDPDGIPTLDAIRLNSIYGNAGLGIELADFTYPSPVSGVVANDPGDGDGGSNHQQNFPVLASATTDGSSVTVAGLLNSTPDTAFFVDLYGSDATDPTGYGEGKQYVGTLLVTTDDSGNASFNNTFNVAIGSNVYISGTATTTGNAPYGDTSEFAQTIQATVTTPVTPPTPTVPPSVSVDDVKQNEGDSGITPFTFTLTRTGDLTSASTVTVSTADGTATAASDYTALNGQVITFAANQATATVTVNVNGDTTVESDETFSVILSAVSNATIGDAVGQGTIVNDDVAVPPPPTMPSLSIAGVKQNEGNTGTTTFAFPVTLSSTSTSVVTVNYATVDGTATTADDDYLAASGTLTIPAGQTTGVINVTVNGDSKFETDETFTLNLSSPTNAALGSATSATGTIVNDDAAPTISIGNVTQSVKTGGMTSFNFVVTLTGSTQLPATVQFVTADGTAQASNGDYDPVSGTLTFNPGTISQDVTVNVYPDTKLAPTGKFYVDLSSATNATISSGVGTGTIDEPARSGSVSGTVANGKAGETIYLDANNNSKFDPGELSTTTNAAGQYSFLSVTAGAYIVRQVLPSGYRQLTPGNNYGDHITVAAGASVKNQNFTDQAPPSGAIISGTIKGGKAGETIYLDFNNDSTLDDGELTTTLTSAGTYRFTQVPAGSYIVRQILPSGISQVTPTRNYGLHITVKNGQTLSNQNFTDHSIPAPQSRPTLTSAFSTIQVSTAPMAAWLDSVTVSPDEQQLLL